MTTVAPVKGPIVIEASQYHRMMLQSKGVCTNCGHVGVPNVTKSEEHDLCPVCIKRAVSGIEIALMKGHVKLAQSVLAAVKDPEHMEN